MEGKLIISSEFKTIHVLYDISISFALTLYMGTVSISFDFFAGFFGLIELQFPVFVVQE